MGKTASIMQSEKKCYLCERTSFLHQHHCIHGTANRKLADKYGLWVWMCMEHHTGGMGVHHNPWLDEQVKGDAQRAFEEKVGTREQFIRIFGKSYL